MKGVITAFALFLSHMTHASLLLEESVKVCLSVPAYAELQIPSTINFESISKNSKGAPKHFRAEGELQLESNSPVQLVAIAPAVSNGIETFTPNVFIDNKRDQMFIDYVAGGRHWIFEWISTCRKMKFRKPVCTQAPWMWWSWPT